MSLCEIRRHHLTFLMWSLVDLHFRNLFPGFKNVSLGNVISSNYASLKRETFISAEDDALFKKFKVSAVSLWLPFQEVQGFQVVQDQWQNEVFRSSRQVSKYPKVSFLPSSSLKFFLRCHPWFYPWPTTISPFRYRPSRFRWDSTSSLGTAVASFSTR